MYITDEQAIKLKDLLICISDITEFDKNSPEYMSDLQETSQTILTELNL